MRPAIELLACGRYAWGNRKRRMCVRGGERCVRGERWVMRKKRKRKSVSHVKVSVVTIADGKNYSSKNKKNPYLKNVGTKKIQTF